MGLDTRDFRHGALPLTIVAMVLVAANMRPAITAIGPVLDEIAADTGLSLATLGALSSVPLITWAIVSPLAHDINRRTGLSRAILASLILLGLGVIVRSLPGTSVTLWVGTALIGVALAVGNVLMPAVIKRDFPGRVPLMMAVYSALLGGVGAIASGVVVPISQAVADGLDDPGAGWRGGLLLTGATLLPFAIVVWALASRGHGGGMTAGARRRTGIWRDPVAWLIAGYMALQSSSFYMLVTWLAFISVSTGRTAVVAGVDVMVYQLFSIAGSLAVPFAMRGAAKRWIAAAVPIVGVAGIALLMAAPSGLGSWVAVLGLFSGASLGVALTLMAERARDHQAASALSGMAQSVGYLFAAVGPIAFGAAHAATGGWMLSLCLLLAVMVGQAVVGVFAGRERFVLEAR